MLFRRWAPQLCTITLLLHSPLAHAATSACAASYLTDEVRGPETVNVYGESFQTLNLFTYHFDGNCRIKPASPWVLQQAEQWRSDPKRLVLIDIVNEIESGPGTCQSLTPGQMLHHLLSDPTRRAAHIDEILAISNLAQGIEIDYENVLPATKPYLTDFIRELRAALPSSIRLASVVQPKTGGITEPGNNVDWRGIEPYVDYIRVMAYYYSWSTSTPGPVITYAKLGQLADYILNDPQQSIPREKARIMLSLYGWDWPISPSSRGSLIRYDEALALAQAHGVTPQRDPVEDTLHFQYIDAQNVTHEVWFDDVVGHQKRIELLLARDFPAIDLWHLNTGDPALWPWYKSVVRTDCPILASVPMTPFPPEFQVADGSPVRVGPNPWHAHRHTGGIRFFNMKPGSKVKIFTVAGHFVKRVDSVGTGALWDLTNQRGEPVASGSYFYLTERGNGSRQRGSVTVIR